MSLYLYGVILNSEPLDFGPIGFPVVSGTKTQVTTVPCGKLSGIIAPSLRDDFKQLHREELVRLLLSHQETLETIMKQFFVLPFKFGTILQNESELTRLLNENNQFLSELAVQKKDFSEIDVIATWEVPKILQEIAKTDPEIAACKKEAAQGGADRAFVGMLLARALKEKADTWRQEISRSLEIHAARSAEHDVLNDEMVLNTSFLVHRDREKEFFNEISELDRCYHGELNFKCVGPLPPYSFATILVKRFDPDQVREAASVLHLNGRAELNEVRKLYKELSKKLHPDLNPSVPQGRFENLNQAYELIADYCEGGPKSLEREAIAKHIRLEVTSTEGGVRDAA